MGAELYLIIVLMCISVISVAKSLFVCLLAICMSSLENYVYSNLLPVFFFNQGIRLLLNCRSSLYILNISSLIDILFVCRCFLPFHMLPLHSVGCVF